MFKDSLTCISKFIENDDQIRVMWNVGDVGGLGSGMFEMWNDLDVGCSGYVMLGIRDVQDVRSWGCGMLIYKMPN